MLTSQMRVRADFLICALSCPALFFGQTQTTMPFDWSTRPKTAGQSVNAPTLELTGTTQVTFKIMNINGMFYDYSMSCAGTPKDTSPLSEVIGLLTTAKSQGEAANLAPSDCDKTALALIDEIKTYLQTAPCDKDCTSVSLADARQKFASFLSRIDDALKCNLSPVPAKGLTDAKAQLNALLAKDTVITFTNPISPDMDYVCTVTEYFHQQPTTGGSMQIAVKPTNTIMTLSVGPLFSAVQNQATPP
jgi:hypothetical protein